MKIIRQWGEILRWRMFFCKNGGFALKDCENPNELIRKR